MKNIEIKLIDSTYEINDAKEVLLSLLNDKIQFLTNKKFSIKERFGTTDQHIEQRLTELTEEKTNLKALMKSLEKENPMITINCAVNINWEQEELTNNSRAHNEVV